MAYICTAAVLDLDLVTRPLTTKAPGSDVPNDLNILRVAYTEVPHSRSFVCLLTSQQRRWGWRQVLLGGWEEKERADCIQCTAGRLLSWSWQVPRLGRN